MVENLSSHVINERQELLIACVLENNNGTSVLAILPLLTDTNKEWTSFSHSYSSLYSILLAENKQQQILKCLCEGLRKLPFDYLTLTPIAANDNKLILLQDAMKTAGLVLSSQS